VIAVEINERGGGVRREEFDADEIRIGRSETHNDLALPRGNVSKHHARIVCREGRMILVDLKSTNGTFLNGRKVTAPMVIQPSDKIYIGDYTLTCQIEDSLDHEDTVEVDATELRLLASIAQQEEGARLVYADWLEQQGDPVRSEFLRIQETIPALAIGSYPAEQLEQLSDRLRELARAISLDWRKKVARPLIEKCLGFELECPKEWGSLSQTERSGVRYCSACAKKVYYCDSVDQARAHATAGNCVAVDLVAIRRPGDLDPPRPVRMGMIMPYDD
jgi:uncharacterized protein (TIGR02996 family)